MSRSLSATVKSAIYAHNTAEVFLFLLDISHADLSPTLRLVNNTVNVTSGGNTYTAFPFQIALPDDSEEGAPIVQVVFGDVDQTIIPKLRVLKTAPDVTLKVVLNSDLNTSIIPSMTFKLREFSYDAESVTAGLAFDYILDEIVPGYSFTPNTHPALFRTS